MAWSLGGINIVVEKDTGDYSKPRIDLTNPLTTTFTTFVNYHGTEGYTRRITGVCFENYSGLYSLQASGTAFELISDIGSQGNYLITNIQPDRVQDIKRSNPVVRVVVDLLKIQS